MNSLIHNLTKLIAVGWWVSARHGNLYCAMVLSFHGHPARYPVCINYPWLRWLQWMVSEFIFWSARGKCMSCQILIFLPIYLELGCFMWFCISLLKNIVNFSENFSKLLNFSYLNSTNFSFLMENLVKFSISHVSNFF
jgi:hypothetical protein